MPATVVEIAEAVKATINAATLSVEVVAVRAYRPLFDLAEMDELHVTVVPHGATMENASRSETQHEVMVDVAVQKRVDVSDLDVVDPLMELLEEITDLFRQKILGDPQVAIWTKTETDPIYSPEHMKEMRQFTGVATLSFRKLRS